MKRIVNIVSALVLSTSLFIGISSTSNIVTKGVSAASISSRQLRSISLSDGDIRFSSDVYEYNVKVKDDVDVIKITARPRDTDSTVSIDGSIVDSDSNNDDGNYKKKVDLEEGKNEIKIKVEDEDGKEKSYILNIYRGVDVPSDTNSSDNSESDNGVYLKELSLNTGAITFSKKTTQYSTTLDDSINKIIIKAIPDADEDDYENYRVVIDGDTVDEDDNFSKSVALQSGQNSFEVKVRDKDYNEKTYTINVFKGSSTASTANVASSNNIDSAYRPVDSNNKWIAQDGWLKLNDGGVIKNNWFYDSSSGNYYYIDSQGFRKKGWVLDNGKWYYLNTTTGVMEKGWIQDSNTWYHLDESGAWIN